MSADTYQMGPATLRYAELASMLTVKGRLELHLGCLLCRISRQSLHSATRQKLVNGMKKAESTDQLGVAFLRGGGPFHIYSTDMEGIFR